MLTFADNLLDLFAATVIFCVGVYIAFAQVHIFHIPKRWALFLYSWHTLFCFFFFAYALNNPADATTYYLISLDYESSFKLGTQGVFFLTSIFSKGMELTYGGTYLVFNLFGFVGMLAFASAVQETLEGSAQRAKLIATITILLPGLSFWTVAIGKDSISFMGAGLAVWAAISLSNRYPAMVLAILAFLLVRPHMAGVLLLSLMLPLLITSGIDIAKKTVLLVVAVPVTVVAVIFAFEFVGLSDNISLSGIDGYLSRRQEYNLDGGSSIDIASMSAVSRLTTYLFRPLFFDTDGVLGIIVSVENSILILVFITSICQKFIGSRSSLNSVAFYFFIIFSLVSLYLLSSTTSNLGIAIRQKWMFLPMLLVLAFSYSRKQRLVMKKIKCTSS